MGREENPFEVNSKNRRKRKKQERIFNQTTESSTRVNHSSNPSTRTTTKQSRKNKASFEPRSIRNKVLIFIFGIVILMTITEINYDNLFYQLMPITEN